jgi:hypothetical protein
MIASLNKLDTLPGDKKEWGICLSVPDDLAQIRKGAAQIGAGSRLFKIGPQQAG